MDAGEEHERGLARFLVGEWRARFRESLAPAKRRDTLRSQLPHLTHLDPRFATPTHESGRVLARSCARRAPRTTAISCLRIPTWTGASFRSTKRSPQLGTAALRTRRSSRACRGGSRTSTARSPATGICSSFRANRDYGRSVARRMPNATAPRPSVPRARAERAAGAGRRPLSRPPRRRRPARRTSSRRTASRARGATGTTHRQS